jgi:hypothetical protein
VVFAGYSAKKVFSKEVLAFVKRQAANVGVKLLQKTIVKYTAPIASIAIGTGRNYATTRAVGKIATDRSKQLVQGD